jgi:hypothetical protein
MIATVFYLIKPNSELIEQLKLAPSDAKIILESSQLWSKAEPDGKWMPTDFMAQVKLLFIFNLKQSYLDSAEKSDFQEFLGNLLGSPPFSIDLFDKWWEIQRLQIDEDFEEVQNSLDPTSLKLVSPTGVPLVDAWLSSLIEQKST